MGEQEAPQAHESPSAASWLVASGTGSHHVTLGDQLAGIELGHRGLENFVADRRQDAVVVVDAVLRVQLRQLLQVRLVQHTEGNSDVLHI